jgi:small subunit ribosomal protein S18
MSDQVNPNPEQQAEMEQTELEQGETAEVSTPRVEPPTVPAVPTVPTVPTGPPAGNVYQANDDFDGDDSDADDDDSDDGDGDDEETSEGPSFEGPAEYVQREKSGRGRRIGGDVRPEDVDYKNIPLLSRFLDRRGRILSRRKTRVSAKVQRRIVQAIKRARHLALLPYTADQTRIVRSKRR